MVTPASEAPVDSSFIGSCAEGRTGREKTDLEVRSADWHRDVASVVQLELSLCQMSQCCLSVSLHLCMRGALQLDVKLVEHSTDQFLFSSVSSLHGVKA